MMRLQQIQSQRQQLLLAENCDYGVEPRANTSQKLDFYIENGELQPVITLSSESQYSFSIRFDVGFSIKKLLKAGQRHVLHRVLETAQVGFLVGDPTFPDVFVVVSYEGMRVERHVMSDDLKPYISFLYADGEEAADDPIAELDEII